MPNSFTTWVFEAAPWPTPDVPQTDHTQTRRSHSHQRLPAYRGEAEPDRWSMLAVRTTGIGQQAGDNVNTSAKQWQPSGEYDI